MENRQEAADQPGVKATWPDTLEELGRQEPRHAEAMRGTSKSFLEPRSSSVTWEVERKPLENTTLLLVTNQPVSRAWELVLALALSACLTQEFGSPFNFPDYRQSDQTLRPGPVQPFIELREQQELDLRRRFIEVLNIATRSANGITRDAAEVCAKDHEDLAREVGLERPSLGFSP